MATGLLAQGGEKRASIMSCLSLIHLSPVFSSQIKQSSTQRFGKRHVLKNVREYLVCRSSSNDKKGFSPRQEKKDIVVVESDQVPSTPPQQITRENILTTCVSTSGIMGLASVALHVASPVISRAAHEEIFQSLYQDSLIGHVGIEECVGMLTTAMAVTGVRLLLLQNWPEFKEATDVANKQILIPLKDNIGDVALVAAMPAMAEELLFRWALVPAVYPDWRGVVISGLVFGILHINGGRNSAFAAWASCVGCVYGFLYIYSGSAAVAVGAHAMSNIFSATLWLQGYKPILMNDDTLIE